MTSHADYTAEFRRMSELLDSALSYLRAQTVELADAENAYRKARAEAWVGVPDATAKQKEDHVNAVTADDRKRRDLAEGMRQGALEAVRSRRTQISALQSLLSADRAELEMAKYGPDDRVPA